MSAPKWILIGTVSLFSVIGVAALFKKRDGDSLAIAISGEKPAIRSETPIISIPAKAQQVHATEPKTATVKESSLLTSSQTSATSSLSRPSTLPKDDFPNIDRIFQLFSVSSSRLPIVETLLILVLFPG